MSSQLGENLHGRTVDLLVFGWEVGSYVAHSNVEYGRQGVRQYRYDLQHDL